MQWKKNYRVNELVQCVSVVIVGDIIIFRIVFEESAIARIMFPCKNG